MLQYAYTETMNTENFAYLNVIREHLQTRLAERNALERELREKIAELDAAIEREQRYYEEELEAAGLKLDSSKADIKSKGLRKASEIILRHKGILSKENLIDILIHNGFDFRDSQPGRAVYMALATDPNIRMYKDGSFEFVGGGVKGGKQARRGGALSLRQGLVQMFLSKQNEPMSVEEAVAEVTELDVWSPTPDIIASVTALLRHKDLFEKIGDRYRLKQEVFQAKKEEIKEDA